MSTYVRWHLIIDVCKARSFWSPSTLEPSRLLVLCWIFYCPICYEAQRSVWSASFRRKKKRTQFHLHVTVTLCNIHHRPFFRPYSMSTGAGFSFVFWLLLIAAKDFGTSKKTLPLFKTWIPSRPPIPLKLLGKLCKEEEAAVELCMQQNCTKEWHWVHNNAHFLSACHSHTQQRLNPQWGWMVLGIWHNTK